jgi:GAF domain-containing protein
MLSLVPTPKKSCRWCSWWRIKFPLPLLRRNCWSRRGKKAQQERLINQIAALVYSPLHPETTLTTVLEQLAAGLQGIGARLRIHFMGADTLCCHGVQPPASYDTWLQEQLGRAGGAGGWVKMWSLSHLEKWPELQEQMKQTPIRGLLVAPARLE